MKIHLFGAATPSGQALRDQAQMDLVGYSRKSISSAHWSYPADLNDPEGFHPAGSSDTPSIWISFAPIWLFASFLEQLEIHHPQRLQGLRGVIACSSSSAVTKRFAAYCFDRLLVERLVEAEDKLSSTCRRLLIPCRILRPTLIYGQVGAYRDRNLSRLLHLMRRWPVLPLPVDTGLRQPIHASQLASVALHLAEQLSGFRLHTFSSECIALGGDTTLTYADMFRALQQSQHPFDPARSCRLLFIPNRLFFFLSAPLLLRSPKAFEAVLRMGSNLSGFTSAHEIVGSEAQPFPVLPLT